MEEEESKIMGLKQDFVLRRLEDQGRFLARLILGKDEAHYELPEYEAMDNRADALYRKLLALVDDGEINEAENILLDELDTGDLNMFEIGVFAFICILHIWMKIFWRSTDTRGRKSEKAWKLWRKTLG